MFYRFSVALAFNPGADKRKSLGFSRNSNGLNEMIVIEKGDKFGRVVQVVN